MKRELDVYLVCIVFFITEQLSGLNSGAHSGRMYIRPSFLCVWGVGWQAGLIVWTDDARTKSNVQY